MGNKYKNNFIKEVIVRVDFASPINELGKDLSSVIINGIKNTFPILEPKKLISKQLQISPQLQDIKSEESTDWIFHDRNKSKHISLTTEHVYISYKIYQSYEILKQDFSNLLDLISKIGKPIDSRRLGLRYINNIDLVNLNEPSPIDWAQYLNEKLLGIFSVPKDANHIARAFHSLFLNFNDSMVHCQYGIHNPDFPSIIKKKIFILDYDTYSTNIQNLDEIKTSLDKFHSIIEDLFEDHIKDDLRKLMRK